MCCEWNKEDDPDNRLVKFRAHMIRQSMKWKHNNEFGEGHESRAQKSQRVIARKIEKSLLLLKLNWMNVRILGVVVDMMFSTLQHGKWIRIRLSVSYKNGAWLVVTTRKTISINPAIIFDNPKPFKSSLCQSRIRGGSNDSSAFWSSQWRRKSNHMTYFTRTRSFA